MTFGGAWGPRGYGEGEVYGDQGLLFKSELLFPAAQWRTHWLRPLLFVDAGVANVREPLQGENRNIELASTGVGLRYALGSTVTLRGDYGWQIKHTGYGANQEGRGHVSFNVAW